MKLNLNLTREEAEGLLDLFDCMINMEVESVDEFPEEADLFKMNEKSLRRLKGGLVSIAKRGKVWKKI